MTVHIPFDNSYSRLPDSFFARVAPTPVIAPRLVKLNRELADQLGLDADELASREGLEIHAGKSLPLGAEPVALAYAGHQFGQFVPQLGDGRAILLGEVVDRDGRRRDLQLKGSGITPFSRGGDGRAALGPVLREYIVSEAMAALGIPTTRALAAVMTGEPVRREVELPGAVLTRVAASHIRVGTFQYFAVRGDMDSVRRLADYAIDRHYREPGPSGQPYLDFLDRVSARQARLVAKWMHVGFIHGVMNTDNTAISGETIDYGPCAFMDAYDPATVFSSIDHMGRYAYGNQPAIAQWNMARLAECLLPLLDEDEKRALEKANKSIGAFPDLFNTAYLDGLRQKLGLGEEHEGDLELAQALLDAMAANEADFTLTFRGLCEASQDPGADEAVRQLFRDPSAYDAWAVRWRRRLAAEQRQGAERAAAMRRANPAVIPRNHKVEAALKAAVEEQDFVPFEDLLAVLSEPYEDRPRDDPYIRPPLPQERVRQTFCGT